MPIRLLVDFSLAEDAAATGISELHVRFEHELLGA